MSTGLAGDERRIEEFQGYHVLDSRADQAFERILQLAQVIAAMPIAGISLLNHDRQWLKSSAGIDLEEFRRTSHCFASANENNGPFIVENAAEHPVFREDRFVRNAPYVRFFAGFPLCTRKGCNIGVLCVMDTRPNALTLERVGALEDLAAIALDALELRRTAACDSLTGCLTRQAFAAVATSELRRARRNEHHLSCIVLDVDHFKTINDTFGHAAGDHVLRTIAGLCRSEMRSHDLLCRYGGEEFVVLLPETDEAGAYGLAERICRAVASHGIYYAHSPLQVTLSGGVGSWQASEVDIEPTFIRADAALYRAKIAGRNQVMRASELSEEALSKFRAA